MITSGNKYYYLPYYWIKEVEGVLVKTGRVSTVNNVSDVMTKSNDEPTLRYLQPRLCGHTGVDGKLFEFDVKKAKYLPPWGIFCDTDNNNNSTICNCFKKSSGNILSAKEFYWKAILGNLYLPKFDKGFVLLSPVIGHIFFLFLFNIVYYSLCFHTQTEGAHRQESLLQEIAAMPLATYIIILPITCIRNVPFTTAISFLLLSDLLTRYQT